MHVILVYDIVTDEAGLSIYRKVFKNCKQYLSHIQNSVFEGDISKAKLKELEVKVKKHLRKEKDSVIVFHVRTEKWLDKEFWGTTDDNTSVFL